MNLRDNFELLEDEHYESMKRFKCLENKIEDLKKTHLMIQTAKVRTFRLKKTIILKPFKRSFIIVIQSFAQNIFSTFNRGNIMQICVGKRKKMTDYF